ncbi:MAG: hypothetical protein ACI841_001325 [Planctomycetota bacterium]|jgi:hypothetical protein
MNSLAQSLPRSIAAAILAAMASVSCTDTVVEPPPSYPAGTVMLVGAKVLSSEDVDRWLDAIDLIEPGRSRAGKRRLVLTNIELHKAIASQVDPPAVQAAREEAEATLAAVLAGESLPNSKRSIETVVEGYWRTLGIDLWHLARTAPLNEWQPVLESTAYFVVWRVTSRDPEPWTKDEGAVIERIVIPYLEEEFAKEIILQAEEITTLTIVDPAWDELLPAHYKYKMGVQPVSRREKPAPEQVEEK